MSHSHPQTRAIKNALNRFSALEKRLTQSSKRVSRFRLYLMLSGITVAVLLQFLSAQLFVWLISLGLIAILFISVLIIHRRLRIFKDKLLTKTGFLHTQIARLKLDWPRLPDTEHESASALSQDLNLIGPTSLSRIIHLPLSPESQQRVNRWLTDESPTVEAAKQRQTQVRSLKQKPGLVYSLIQAHSGVSLSNRESRQLKTWLEQAEYKRFGMARFFALTAWALINIALIVLSQRLNAFPPVWIPSVALYVLIFFIQLKDTQAIFQDAGNMERSLRVYQSIFGSLEKARIPQSDALSEILAPFRAESNRPSKLMRKIGRALNLIGLRNNVFSGILLNAVCAWDALAATYAVRQFEELQRIMPVWLEHIIELEALSMLGNYARLHRQLPFPDFNQASPLISAENVQHPLISAEQNVGNDIHIEKPGEIHLITGSNMSGKSTYLKSSAINLLLAFAGGPVHADRFQCAPVSLSTCINVHDSIIKGYSFFYTEVRRLSELLRQLEDNPRPLLFFIDEIFKGTNNRERLIGSRSLIRALAEKNTAGMISTHDLELTALADEIPGIRNLHFRETVEDGQMRFDYRLRSGPCPTTNALEIMRLEGLPVEST